MTVREVRKQETVRRILDTAAQEFAEIGYEGARVDRIADRARVNKAMIYYHIGDKQALYTRVLHEVFGDTAVRLAETINEASSPDDKIRAYIRSIDQTQKQHPHLLHIMMRELASGGKNLPEVVVNHLSNIIGWISKVIQEGCQCGRFARVDPFVLHMMVIGGISYFKASDPVRRRFPNLADELTAEGSDDPTFDLIGRVEQIVLGALTVRAEET